MAADIRPRGGNISVVTVSFRSGDVLGRMLSSLERASRRLHSVVVADNADDADARRIVADFGYRYVAVDGNPGYGAAVNRAAATLEGDASWIVVANPDVEFSPGSIDRLVDAVDADPEIGAAGPLILTPDGDVYPSARQLPTLLHGAGHAVFSRIWPANPWSRAYRRELGEPTDRDAGWLSGSCFAIRAVVFHELGGFDESYFMYFEDVDLGRRLTERGYRMRYVTSASVLHLGGTSTASAALEMIDAHHRSARQYLERVYDAWWQAPVRLALGLGLAARARILRRRA